jgi:hypothetical protein
MEPEARVDASGLAIRPLPDGSDVRKSTAADLTHVVEAVARSFYEDPIFRWIAPDDGRRLGELERGFALFARRVWFPHDETYTTDRLIGGALWMPPGTWHLSLFTQLSMLPAMAVILRAVAALAERDRGEASARAPLLPAVDRHPARVAGTRVRLRAAAADPRALRPRAAAGLFGGVEPAQPGALRAARVCGGRGDASLRLAAMWPMWREAKP